MSKQGTARYQIEFPPTPKDIHAARVEAGLDTYDAAFKAGYTDRSQWSHVESGRRQMQPWRWAYWLHVTGVQRLPFKQRR